MANYRLTPELYRENSVGQSLREVIFYVKFPVKLVKIEICNFFSSELSIMIIDINHLYAE